MFETAEHSSSYLLELVDLAKPKLKQRLPQLPSQWPLSAPWGSTGDFWPCPQKSLQRGSFCSVQGSVLLPQLQASHPSYTQENWLFFWILPGKTTHNGIIWHVNFSQIQYSNEHIIPQRLFLFSFSSVMF